MRVVRQGVMVGHLVARMKKARGHVATGWWAS